MKKLFLALGVVAGCVSASWPAPSMTGQRLRVAEVDYSTHGYPSTLVFGNNQLTYQGSTAIVTIVPGVGGGGSAGDNLTSSTMTWMNGNVGGNAGTAMSFQANSSTKGYVDQFGVLRWGNWAASRPVFVGTNSWVGIGLTPLAPLYVKPDPADGDNSGLLAYFDGTLNSGLVALPPRVLFRPRNSTEGQFNLDFNVTPGHSVWKYYYNLIPSPNQYRFTFQLNHSTVVTMRENWRVGINTSTPESALHVSSGAGSTESIFMVSTGATKLFEITGSSATFYLDMFNANGSPYLTSVNLGLGQVVSSNIAANTIQGRNIGSRVVVSSHIAANTIGGINLAANAIVSTHIAPGVLSSTVPMNFQDEGSAIAQASTMNFVGAGVSAAMSGGVLTITINGGAGGGDNLGNHTATITLNMSNFPIINVSSIGIGANGAPPVIFSTDTFTFYVGGSTLVVGASTITFNGLILSTAQLINTGAVAGSYTNSNITIDAQGRITTAANGAAGGGGGGAINAYINNNTDTGVDITTFGFIIANGLSASFTGSSVTLSIPTTAQMTVNQMVVSSSFTAHGQIRPQHMATRFTTPTTGYLVVVGTPTLDGTTYYSYVKPDCVDGTCIGSYTFVNYGGNQPYLGLSTVTVLPSGTPERAIFYSSGSAAGVAEMWVVDSATNRTQISPHNAKNEWEYFSCNDRTGRCVKINMERMVRKLEDLLGEKFMYEYYER